MIEQPTVSRQVQQMAKAGLVIRQRNRHSGRVTDVLLTAQGRRLYAQILPLACALEQRAIAGLTAGDRVRLAEALRTMIGTLR